MLYLPPARCLKCSGTNNLTIHHSPSRAVIKHYAPLLSQKFKQQFSNRPEIGLFVLCTPCHKQFTAIENQLKKDVLQTVVSTFTSAFSVFTGFSTVPAWEYCNKKNSANKSKKINSDARRYSAL